MPLRFLSLATAVLVFLTVSPGHAQQPAATAPAPATTNAPDATPTDPTTQLIQDAIKKMNSGDVDGAMAKLTEAIRINPKSSGAYALRGSIYSQKRQSQQAQDDFNTALKLAPTNIVIKLNMAEIKFIQKEYDLARPGYQALESDPDMGDLASYKVFLCDLFAGHEDVAAKELADFNKVGANPSYYFANAAWDLYHKNIEDARGWLVSASNIFALRKNIYYAQSLRDLGYLPLPEPAAPAK